MNGPEQMSGPEHYTEAQRLLEQAPDTTNEMLRALTHAVLALVAANVGNDGETGFDGTDYRRWLEAGAIGPYEPVS